MGHFEPLWALRRQTLIGRISAKMKIAKFGARKVDFVGGGIVGTYTCSACSRKARTTSASAIRNICASCDMNHRPYCICGTQFRLTRHTLGETTCATCREAKRDAILEKSREIAKSQDRLCASTLQAMKNAAARKSTDEAKLTTLARNSTPQAMKNAFARKSTPEAMQKAARKSTDEAKLKTSARNSTPEAKVSREKNDCAQRAGIYHIKFPTRALLYRAPAKSPSEMGHL